ncbi:MAG: UxaA family hydrolase [Sulfolobales archaeon]
MRKALILNPRDNVAVALSNLKENEEVEIQAEDKVIIVKLVNEIPFGHKFSIKAIRSGEPILKYGEVIGIAIKDIIAGEHVHIHNVKGLRGRPQDE